MAKYKLSRRGKKLQMSDDQRTLVALPKDVPERTWYFLRHDPGEDPSAFPPCYIPKRRESWVPDDLPDPSPTDTWCKYRLSVQEDFQEESFKKCPSSSSLDMPVIEDIPEEYWFPGKVNFPIDSTEATETSKMTSYETESSLWSRASEQLQRVTDYSEPRLASQDSTVSAPESPSAATGSMRGAGDAGGTVEAGEAGEEGRRSRRRTEKSKLFSKVSMLGRSKGTLQPLEGDSRSRISIISDCRLRNLRLDTQYEITSEKIDTPPGEMVKRK